MSAYDIEIDQELEKTLSKLDKKDRGNFERVGKKILQVAENPHAGKPLKSILKGKWRVHVGHFVLFYRIDETEKKVVFLDFVHHDDAYQ